MIATQRFAWNAGELLVNYSNAQPRDNQGRWSSGGGGGGAMASDTGGSFGGTGGEHLVTVMHGTTESVISEILKEGIKPSDPKLQKKKFKSSEVKGQPSGVYVTDDFKGAVYWAGFAKRVSKGRAAVIEVSLPKSSLKTDPALPDNQYSSEAIPPSAIRKITFVEIRQAKVGAGRWKPEFKKEEHVVKDGVMVNVEMVTVFIPLLIADDLAVENSFVWNARTLLETASGEDGWRVAEAMPDESWKSPPTIREDEDDFPPVFNEDEWVDNYSNAQPRDSHGRWSSGGGGGSMSPDTGGSFGGSGRNPEPSPEEWAAGLPSSQKASIEKWVNGDQSKIRALQAGKQIPPKDRKKYAKRLDEMNAALENAPRFEGTLYRGMAVRTDADVLKKLNVGSVVELEAHSSSSSDASTAACFSDKYGLLGDRVQVLMKINQKTGVDISPVANKTYAWQKEHLLLKGSRYRVDSIKTESVEAHWNEPGSSGRPKTVDNVMIVEMSEI